MRWLQSSQRRLPSAELQGWASEKHGLAFQPSEGQGWSQEFGSEEESLSFASLVSKSF